MRTIRFYGFIFIYALFKKRAINRLMTKYEAGGDVSVEINKIAKYAARKLINISGSTISVEGIERLSENETYLFVGNHQSNVDILTLLSILPHRVGFVAKKELLKLPIIRQAMILSQSIFLDRSDSRKAIKTINIGIELLKSGQSLVIFPEGKRSKSHVMNVFKTGSLRLALKSGVKVVPISINNTYKVMEDNQGKIKPARITVVFSEPINSKKYSTVAELSEAVEASIRQHL